MNEESIGTIIKNIRKEHNLSQQELSDILGLNNSTISKWEHDLITPDITYLKIISQKFNIPIDKLIAGETKPLKKPKIVLILSVALIISIIIIVYLLIQLKYNNNYYLYDISSSNANIELTGTLVNNNEEAYLRINKITYLHDKIGTTDYLIPEKVTIKVNINEKTVENIYIENEDAMPIEEILSNTQITIKEKYKKTDNINLELIIQDNKKIYEESTIINHNNIIK